MENTITNNPAIEFTEPPMRAGALISEHDDEDHIFEHIGRASDNKHETITSIDLRTKQAPRNQKDRDTCAAFAAATIKQLHEFKDCNFDEYMSPEWIYYHRENKPAHGMYGRNVFKILQNIGSVPESMYPYGSTHAPPDHLYDIAAKYKIGNYAKISTCYGLKNAIAEIGPAYMVLPLNKTRPEFWRGEKSTVESGHALAVIGYDEIGFLLSNSWGPEWANNGTIIFPYADWHYVLECWISIDEKTSMVDAKEPKTPRSNTDPVPTRKPRRTKRRSLSETLINTLSDENLIGKK